jgi:hypothetical protein
VNRAVNDESKIANPPVARAERPRFGLGYKSFVAWRYLMDARRSPRPMILWMLLIGAAVLSGTALLRAFVAFEALHGYDPLQIVELAALGFVVVVVFLGVLPQSKLR